MGAFLSFSRMTTTETGNPVQKWVLVTGAATGIGRATAEYLTKNGFGVYAGARKPADLDALAKIPGIQPIKLEVTSDSDVQAVIAEIEKKGTGLYGLVNNAGIVKAGPLMDLPLDHIREIMEVNFFAVHRITKACFPLLLASRGRIVMMSSDSGFFGTPFSGPYCSSKFALEGYTDSLRRELIPTGIKLSLIEPGHVNTAIWDKTEQILKQFEGVDSIFRADAEKLAKYAINKGRTRGLPPVEVAKVIYTALTATKPKIRYLVAKHKLEYYLVRILPATKVDKMVREKIEKLKAHRP